MNFLVGRQYRLCIGNDNEVIAKILNIEKVGDNNHYWVKFIKDGDGNGSLVGFESSYLYCSLLTWYNAWHKIKNNSL